MLIDLAREADFALGGMTVRPSTRELNAGGRAELLEPRIMQVLVALARRRGQVVSRDDLIDACWGGRAVGEDAINRCISAIRKLSEAHGGFLITTVARVGYRLDESALPFAKPALPVEPLLAVLAFDNLSGDAEMAWFSEGVSEEILQTVAHSAELKVIGRGSSFQFQGSDKAARKVAAELNATHVLDGSVRRSGSRVRIAAHLIECAGQTTLWSDRFDRDLTDIFTLQDEIAGAVAAALRVAFAPKARAEAIDPAAYDLYLTALRMRAGVFLESGETRDAAIRLVEQATTLAPRFARAWVYLAHLRVDHLRTTRLQPDDLGQPYEVIRATVVEAAETALKLDPALGEAYQVLSDLEPFSAVQDREALHNRALDVAPNDPDVLYEASHLSGETGRIREALARVKLAHELDPKLGSAANWYGCMLDAEGRYQESRPLWDRFRVLWPGSEVIAWNSISSAANNADWDRFDNLIKAVRQSGLYTPQIRRVIWFGRNLRSPDAESMRAALNQAREEVAKSGDATLEGLTSLYRLGFRQDVFDLIDQASFAYIFDPQKRWSGGLTVTTIFSVMHNAEMMRDPRFVRLCAKLGLCRYWVETNRWPDCADDGVLPYDFKAECRRLEGDAHFTGTQ